jgi:type II secretion system protein N
MDLDFVHEHALQIGYGAVGALLFFAFLFATFPYADVLSGILAPIGVRVSSRDQGVSFPFGIRMDGVKLDAQDGGRSFFQSDKLRVTPSLLSLLMGSPGVKVNADAYGGNFDLRAHRSGDATALSFSGSDLHLESYTALSAMGVNLGGLLSGSGDLYISQQDFADDRGMLHLSASAATYRLLPGTPPLKLGNFTATIKLDKGKVDIEQLETHGGDLTLSGRGVIDVQPNLPDSEVAIRFQLDATPAGRDRLGLLINFLPHPPNSTPYFLHGTLGSPALS